MRAYEFLTESAPRTLYHGTLKANVPSIMQGGLEPRIGEFTAHWYDPDEDDLEDLVFASSKKDIQKGLSSIVHYLKQQKIDPSPENIIKYGAMVVIKDEREDFIQRHYDPDQDEYAYDHPYQVEPGDFYARRYVKPAFILQDKKLKDLLRREGFDAWMGTKHPRFQNKG